MQNFLKVSQQRKDPILLIHVRPPVADTKVPPLASNHLIAHMIDIRSWFRLTWRGSEDNPYLVVLDSLDYVGRLLGCNPDNVGFWNNLVGRYLVVSQRLLDEQTNTGSSSTNCNSHRPERNRD